MAEKSVGALWSKKSGKGADFFTGNIEIEGVKHPIVVFYNAKKDKENQPDWHIYHSKPREERENVVPDDLDPSDVPF